MLQSHNYVNLNGSHDPFYRYQMPRAELRNEKHKAVFCNIQEVCKAVGRPPEYLTRYLGQELNCSVRLSQGRAFLPPSTETTKLQSLVFSFLHDIVMCPSCGNPETLPCVEGKKKKKKVLLCCKACGTTTALDSDLKIVKFIMQHPLTPSNVAPFGTAYTVAAAETSVAAHQAGGESLLTRAEAAAGGEEDDWPEDDWDEQ